MSLIHQVISLSAAGVEFLVDTSSGTPVIAHWGRALSGDTSAVDIADLLHEATPHSDLDTPMNPGVWRERGRGFFGSPTLAGQRNRKDWAPLFVVSDVTREGNAVTITSVDTTAQLSGTVRYELLPSGVLLADLSVTNTGDIAYKVDELTTWFPLPDRAVKSMDFHGRWIKERQPQVRPIQFGSFVREVREGRSGHAYTVVQMALSENVSYSQGEVWGLSLLWSGNSRHAVEQYQTGRKAMGAGELLEQGEISLAPGETYAAPTVAATYSDEGFDGLSHRLHSWTRSRPQHPTKLKPRPLTLNVWEAVYMDHNFEKLSELIDVSQRIGVERFVLDDGWFGARRDDKAGLGDWTVSADAWPDGLKPLIDRVKAAGMEFGLWFEGEMVNPDSDLYREHPEWILQLEGRTPPLGRNQHVLDITHEGAYDFILSHVDAVLTEYDIDYIKWDHNKVLVDPGHNGIAAVHNQTVALYRLFDELKLRHPGLEIESCSSGGARIDLGMVQHADRFWASDCNDALERQHIQRYTQFAIPPEMVGSHIGPHHSHTTGRTHDLSFRAITALFGHAGLEWDITETTEEERVTLTSWANFYKDRRSLLHSGRVTRADHSDASAFVHGVVAQDKSEALFAYVQLTTIDGTKPHAVLLSGLDPNALYTVALVEPAGASGVTQIAPPAWLAGITVPGSVLAEVGLRPPILRPEQAILIDVRRAN